MKCRSIINSLGNWSLISILLILCSCSKWSIPSEYLGEWQTDRTIITVRTEPKWMKFQFTTDTAVISIKIKSDKIVSGFIGSTEIVNGKLKKNWGLPSSYTGVSYIIECGSIGRIFNSDPVNRKEVEIWISPIKDNEVLEAELRFIENKAVFPMASLLFHKVNNKKNKTTLKIILTLL